MAQFQLFLQISFYFLMELTIFYYFFEFRHANPWSFTDFYIRWSPKWDQLLINPPEFIICWQFLTSWRIRPGKKSWPFSLQWLWWGPRFWGRLLRHLNSCIFWPHLWGTKLKKDGGFRLIHRDWKLSFCRCILRKKCLRTWSVFLEGCCLCIIGCKKGKLLLFEARS